jgi:hypothetical protein
MTLQKQSGSLADPSGLSIWQSIGELQDRVANFNLRKNDGAMTKDDKINFALVTTKTARHDSVAAQPEPQHCPPLCEHPNPMV